MNVVSSVVQFFCAILFLLVIILNDNAHFIETISKCVSFYADFFFYFGNYNSFWFTFFEAQNLDHILQQTVASPSKVPMTIDERKRIG